MLERFTSLPAEERREALAVAAGRLRRAVHLLEKDVWVVWIIQTLFQASFADHLSFKGGTSLSKAYGIIRRFSEDVDLTYDIRALAPDLTGSAGDPLPATRSQQKKWTDEIRARLPLWISNTVTPAIEHRLVAENLPARIAQEADRLTIEYEALTTHSHYIRPTVLLEFGARSTGEPAESRGIICDASAVLPELEFPRANPRVMRVERTFWEKATAMHVYCAQGRFRGGERFSRHWHDLCRLHDCGVAGRAVADRELAQRVARHKSAFFPERDSAGEWINYSHSVNGQLHLVPDGNALASLAGDYARMVGDGLLLDDAESFDELITRCASIEELANAPHDRAS